jgi:hypothetical protein
VKKILILASNPRQDLNLDREIRDLRDVVESSRNREAFDVEDALAVRVGDLQDLLLEHSPYIVHFCGHGGGQSGLVLEGKDGGEQCVRTDALRDLFRLFSRQVKCVVLNACYSEEQADEIVNHIDYVIGMDQEIRDDAAIAFSKGFYRALGHGCSIEEAYDFGCNAIQLEISISTSLRSADTATRKAEVVRAAAKTIIPEHLKPVLRKRSGIPLSDVQGTPQQPLTPEKREAFKEGLAAEIVDEFSPPRSTGPQSVLAELTPTFPQPQKAQHGTRSGAVAVEPVPQSWVDTRPIPRRRSFVPYLIGGSVIVGLMGSFGLYNYVKSRPISPAVVAPTDAPDPSETEPPIVVNPELTHLEQAKEFASKGEWLAAIETLRKIPDDNQDAGQRDILLTSYALPLLESARKYYNEGYLEKALRRAQAIPENTPHYADAQEDLAIWNQDKAAIAEINKAFAVHDIDTPPGWLDKIKNPVIQAQKREQYEALKQKVTQPKEGGKQNGNQNPDQDKSPNEGQVPDPRDQGQTEGSENTQPPGWEISEYGWLSTEAPTEEQLIEKLGLSGDALKQKLAFTRNALFAKCGYSFSASSNFRAYFDQQTWYKPKDISQEDCFAAFSPIEKANLKLIQAIEKRSE